MKTLGRGKNGKYRYPREVENAKAREYRARIKSGAAPQHNRTPRKLKDRECKACGKVFRPENARVWCCSKSCAGHLAASTKGHVKSSPVYFYVCATCGLVRTCRQPSQKTCSTECAKKYGREKARESWERRSGRNRSPRACPECGDVFTPKYGDKRTRYCSRSCGKAHVRRELGKGGFSRARKKGLRREPLWRSRVFERDGWTCQICGKATPKARRGTRYSNAPELDHRVPLALGGSHTYDNVQCACRACNGAKGGHTIIGQLPLLRLA